MDTILVPVDDNEDRARNQAQFVSTLPVDTDAVEVVLTYILVGVEKEALQAMRRPDRVGTVRAARERLESRDLDVPLREAGVTI